MKKIGIILVLLTVLVGCSKEGKTIYTHVTMENETNMYYQVGFVDDVFEGKIIKREYEYNDDSVDTIFTIQVTKQYKGDIVTEVKARYHGGYLKNGNLELRIGDEITEVYYPNIEDTCVFLVCSQPNGEMLILDVVGIQSVDDFKQDYIDQAEEVQRDRFYNDYENIYMIES